MPHLSSARQLHALWHAPLSNMASVLKVQKANASKIEGKKKGKRKADDMDVDEDEAGVSVPNLTQLE